MKPGDLCKVCRIYDGFQLNVSNPIDPNSLSDRPGPPMFRGSVGVVVAVVKSIRIKDASWVYVMVPGGAGWAPRNALETL